MTLVWVIGNGGHAKVVVDAIVSEGQYEIKGILSDAPEEVPIAPNVPHEGPITKDIIGRLGIRHAVIAIGSNLVRARIADVLYELVDFVPVIHPSATVASTASIGRGAVVCAGSVVQPSVTLGAHCIVNTGATVDHDCRIAPFVHIAPGVHLAGDVSVGQGTLLGIGAVVIPGVTIGEDAVVGAGSVVIRDVDPGSRVAGVPAQLLRS